MTKRNFVGAAKRQLGAAAIADKKAETRHAIAVGKYQRDRAGETLEEQMSGIAKSVARRYYSRLWWRCDLEELEQQAWVVVLEVLREYPPLLEDGTLDRDAFGAWAYTAAMRQLSRWLWRDSAPVSTSDGDLRNLAGVYRAQVSPRLPDPTPTQEQLVGAKQIEDVIRPLLRARISELYARVLRRDGPDAFLEATLSIYLDGEAPRDAARRLGVPIYDLYKTTEYMRAAMRSDDRLADLGRQLIEMEIQ